MNSTWHILSISALSCFIVSATSSATSSGILHPLQSLSHPLCCVCVTCLCGNPHMVMIETLSLDQMAHLSHTCLPTAAVARAFWAAGESISCWLPYWVARLFVRVPWPLTPLPPPALTLLVNVTLDSPTDPTLPLFRCHGTHAWLWGARNMEWSTLATLGLS